MLKIEQAVRERWAGESETLLLRRTKELSDQVTSAAATMRNRRQRERESELGRPLEFSEMESIIAETLNTALEETVAQIWDGVTSDPRPPQWMDPMLSAEERDEALIERQLPALQRWTTIAATATPSAQAEDLTTHLWPDKPAQWRAHAEQLIQALIEDLDVRKSQPTHQITQLLPISPQEMALLVDQRIFEIDQTLANLGVETN